MLSEADGLQWRKSERSKGDENRMKRLLSAAIQLILLAPALICVPYVVAIVPALFPPSESNRIKSIFEFSLAASILLGLMTAVIVIFSGANHIRTDSNSKKIIQLGLALGIYGGCSVLIWAVKYIVHERAPHYGSAILSWALFLGPPIAEVTYLFVSLMRPIRPRNERSVLSTGKLTSFRTRS
jgi:hypothetical protein